MQPVFRLSLFLLKGPRQLVSAHVLIAALLPWFTRARTGSVLLFPPPSASYLPSVCSCLLMIDSPLSSFSFPPPRLAPEMEPCIQTPPACPKGPPKAASRGCMLCWKEYLLPLFFSVLSTPPLSRRSRSIFRSLLPLLETFLLFFHPPGCFSSLLLPLHLLPILFLSFLPVSPAFFSICPHCRVIGEDPEIPEEMELMESTKELKAAAAFLINNEGVRSLTPLCCSSSSPPVGGAAPPPSTPEAWLLDAHADVLQLFLHPPLLLPAPFLLLFCCCHPRVEGRWATHRPVF